MKNVNEEVKETASSQERTVAAVVQAAPVAFDRDRTLEKVRALAGDAAGQGAQLVLFPEAFVSAYPRGMDFGSVIGARSDEGREAFRRYWESSVDVPGPAVDELARTARDYAIYLGKALQLTNILRDVKNDAARGRIYLPRTELDRFRVSERELLEGHYSERYFALAGAVAGRAREFYRLAQKTLPAADRKAMVAAELMGSVYWRLLLKLDRRRFDVFGPRPPKLGKASKLALIARSWCRHAVGATSPTYGVS